jgi:hypothetical protein
MPRDFDISPYFEIVKPTIVHGFDYTALHWADKQKPLQEVAGQFGVFPETVKSPSLVPEAVDEETPLPAVEIAFDDQLVLDDEEVLLIDCVTVAEQPIDIEYVPVSAPNPRAGTRANEPID